MQKFRVFCCFSKQKVKNLHQSLFSKFLSHEGFSGLSMIFQFFPGYLSIFQDILVFFNIFLFLHDILYFSGIFLYYIGFFKDFSVHFNVEYFSRDWARIARVMFTTDVLVVGSKCLCIRTLQFANIGNAVLWLRFGWFGIFYSNTRGVTFIVCWEGTYPHRMVPLSTATPLASTCVKWLSVLALSVSGSSWPTDCQEMCK